MDTVQQPVNPTPESEHDTRNWKRAMWGIFLMVLGGAFLLERMGLVDMPTAGRLWPLVFFVIGAIRFIERRPGSAVTFMLFGVWFFACNEGWWGIDYRNSWGLILVAVGAGMVIRAFSGEDGRRWRRRFRRLS